MAIRQGILNDMVPYVTIIHEDPEMSGGILVELKEGERIVVGNSPYADVPVCGPGSAAHCVSLFNYDNEQVFISRAGITHETRLRTEDRKLSMAIEEQKGMAGTLPALEVFLKDLRGMPAPGQITPVVLDSHEMKGSEPHMFNLAENRVLVGNSFYLRVNVPMKGMRNDDFLMQDMNKELTPSEQRAKDRKSREEDELFFMKTESYYKGFSTMGKSDVRDLRDCTRNLGNDLPTRFGANRAHMVYLHLLELSNRRGFDRGQIVEL